MWTGRRWTAVSVVVVAAAVVIVARRMGPPGYHAPALTFDGSTDALKQTVVLPTLDTPLPSGKSAIWCSTFGVAWQRMIADVVRQPLRVEGSQQVADRLNGLKAPEDDLSPETSYAAAGRTSDGIVERIQSDMKARFPSVPTPRFRGASGPGALVSYGYLQAGIRFDRPYMENTEPLAFHSPDGGIVEITSFGLRKTDSDVSYRALRDQVEMLYVSGDRLERKPDEFALDLCRTSRDVQVVVACVPRKTTLAEAIAYVRKQHDAVGSPMSGPRLGPSDTLLVPDLCWRVDHHFRELEGHTLLNVGLPIVEASQTIAFHLDRSGAGVESESKLVAGSIPTEFVFDRPFLIYLKKRGAKDPFFAMWVDNAELLGTWKEVH